MLDIKFVRDNADDVQKGLDRRNGGWSISELLSTDKQVRELLAEAEALRRRSNEISEQFKSGKLAKEEMESLRAEVKELKKKQEQKDK